MNIFITGATGLVGRHLLKALRDHKDITITALTRNIDRAKKRCDQNVHWVSHLNEVDINKVDGIVNLAGEPIADRRWTASQKQAIYDSRIQLTNAIADKVEEAEQKPTFIINASAVGYYGRQSDITITEAFNHPYHEFTHTLCADWEAAAMRMASHSTRVAIIRLGIVLSPDGGALKKMLLPFRLGLGGRLGMGDQWMSWIHIQDVVRCIIWLIDNSSASGLFNCTAPQPATNRAFAKTLSSTLNRPCALHQPAAIVRFLFGELADILVYGQKVVPTRLQESGFNFEYDQLSEALSNLLKH